MTRLTNCLLIFMVFAALTGLGAQAAASPAKPSLSQEMDSVLEQALEQKRLVGAVVILAHNGQIIYKKAVGQADRETGAAMKVDAIFRLSSLSKAYTAMAVGVLLEQGKISLNDPVSKYLPYFTPALKDGTKPVITIGHLLSHTAGLDYGFNQGQDGAYAKAGVSDGLDSVNMTLEDNLRRLASVPLLFAPGLSWNYSLAMDVLGAVVEQVTGLPLAQAMDELVCNPLKLQDTGFTVKDLKRLTKPYYNDQPQPKPMRASEYLPFGQGLISFAPQRCLEPGVYASGGAGLMGTAPDMMTLLEAMRQDGRPLLSKALLRQMCANQIGENRFAPGIAFGLGWAVIVDPQAALTPQSPGTIAWSGVYGHCWFMDPVKNISMVIMSNTAFEGMVGKTVFSLRDVVYNHLP